MITVTLFVGSRYPVDRKKIRQYAKDFLVSRGLDDYIVNLSIVGERKIKALNERFLGHEGVTDVLSFPQYQKGSSVDYASTLDPRPKGEESGEFIVAPVSQKILGDIVVCFPEVVRQAMKKGKMVDDHICYLVDHALHHLLGEHHE